MTTSAQVFKTSVKTTNESPFKDYSHPDDQLQDHNLPSILNFFCLYYNFNKLRAVYSSKYGIVLNISRSMLHLKQDCQNWVFSRREKKSLFTFAVDWSMSSSSSDELHEFPPPPEWLKDKIITAIFNKCRKHSGIAWSLVYVALWLVQKTRTSLSTNQMQN